jgi:cellulose 1,4-beta-cellobiosidase
MWVTGAVMNVPSDGSQRSVADAIAVVAPKPAIPAAPASLTAVVSGTNASLTWSLASGAMSYKVKRSTTNGGPYATIAQTAATSYSNTNLSPGTAYYYVVTALNTVGESTNSLSVNAVTVPLAPAGLSAAAGNTQAILSWNLANFAAGYKLKRATVSGGPYTTVATIGSTAWTNTGLANGATYYFVVSATNTAGEGANSGQVSVVPQCFAPAIPGGLSAAMVGGQINLKWYSVSGAQSYTIQRSTTNGGPYSVLAAGIITTNFADAVADFLQLHCAVRNKARTAGETERLLNRHWLPVFSRKTLQEIRTQDVSAVLDGLLGTPSIAVNSLAAVRKFFNWARQRRLTDRSPCEGLQLEGGGRQQVDGGGIQRQSDDRAGSAGERLRHQLYAGHM